MLTAVSSVDTPRERDFMDENSGLIDLKTVREHATIMHAAFERDGGFTYSPARLRPSRIRSLRQQHRDGVRGAADRDGPRGLYREEQ